MDKRLALLNKISDSTVLTDEDFAQVDYINLHAHSTYSLQDAVAPVEDHFIETIKQGHCGCCITDHGSYASFADLDVLKNNKSKSKKVAKIFEERNLKKHDVVFGTELYIIDDRHVEPLKKLASEGKEKEIVEVLKSMESNPKWSALFRDSEVLSSGSISDQEVLKDKGDNKLGSKLINHLEMDTFAVGGPEETIRLVNEFCDKSLKIKSYKYNHITLMAKNYQGHQNICHLTSIGSKPDHFYLRPRIRFSELLANKEGLVVTTGCFIGMIPHAIYAKTGEEKELFEVFRKEFGGDFYVEIHLADLTMEWSSKIKAHYDRGYNPQKDVNDRLLELVEEYGMQDKVYITQDSHLPTKEHKDIQDILLTNDERNSSGWHFYEAYYIMSVKQMYEKMRKVYPHYTNTQFINWCFNSIEVLKKCKDVEIDTDFKLKKPDYKNHFSVCPLVVSTEHLKSHKLSAVDEILLEEHIIEELNDGSDKWKTDPRIDLAATLAKIEHHKETDTQIEEIFKSDNYFVKKAKRFYQNGDIGTKVFIRTGLLIKKFDFSQQHLLDRFFFELNTIQYNGVLGLSDYFLHFEKFSALGRRARRYKGPGRGSAAGCYLSYTLDITNIRPDRYDLLFERFLQEERIGIVFFEHSAHKAPYKQGADWSAWESIVAEVSGKVDAKFRKNYEEEIYYLECKPQVAHYLLELREKANGEVLENENNSYIAYLLGIAKEPTGRIKKTPPALPDIDYDSSYRDLICEYLLKKHGEDHFAYICNYQTMKLKSSISDVLRVRNLDNGRPVSLDEVKIITSEVEKIKLSEEDNDKGQIHCMDIIIKESPFLNKFFGDNPKIRDCVETFLGTYKTMGIHAAGVIICNQPITRCAPCRFDVERGAYVTQLAKDHAERIGLVKKDLLGLIACEQIERCADFILENHGVDFMEQGKDEWIMLNLPDPIKNRLIDADTTGIFQQNTPTAVSFFKRIHQIDDIMNFSALANALLRPGPMGSGMHLKVADILNGRIPVTYIHPLVEPILKDTYGALVYQEQVMKICQVMGGLTALEADNVRKAMGKKKFSELAKYEEKFVGYAMKGNSVPEAIAREMWEQMKSFAEYGFNKSHAVSYAGVSCIQLYFYEQYKLEWIASLLSVASSQTGEKAKKDYKLFYSKWNEFISNPSVNQSKADYQIRAGRIYMPLHILAKVGLEVARDIVSMQPFNSFKDFVMKSKAVGRGSKTVIEAIVYSGCADEFTPKKGVIKKKLQDHDMSVLEDVKLLLDYARVFGKTFDISGTEEIQECIDNDMYISEELLQNYANEVFESGLFDVELTEVKFRKYLLNKFFTEYQPVALSKKFRDVLDEQNLHTPQNVAKILMDGTTKFFDEFPLVGEALVTKKGTFPKLIEGYSEKSFVEAQESCNEFMQLSTNRMILRQLEYLKFTTYDFSGVFSQEIKKIEEDKKLSVRTLEEVETDYNEILRVAEWQNSQLTNLVQKPLADDSFIDVLVREKYLAEVYHSYTANFGWQSKGIAQSTTVKDLSVLDPKKKFAHLFYRRFLSRFIKPVPCEDQTFGVAISTPMSKEEIDSIRAYTQGQTNLMTVSATNRIIVGMDDIQDIIMLKMIHTKNPICGIFSKNKTILAMAQELQEDLQKDKFLGSAIEKLQISEQMELLMTEGVRLMCSGLNPEKDSVLITKIEELKECIESFGITKYLKNLMEDGVYVFGTVFRPEKKKFLKDIGKGNYQRRAMNVFLSDKSGQLPLRVDYVEKEFLTPVSIYNKNEKTPLVDAFADFTPVIVKAKININLRDFSCDLNYVSNTAISLMELF